KCIGCKMCVRDCPANAIAVNKVDEKRYEAVFDLRRCIYCGQCVDSCLKKALAASAEFELAQLDKNKLKVVFHPSSQETTGF
ncbi:MAG: 4Fe-4S dicluster domain-containing protein, partial [Candidatus Omnitrophica bacterium]|nr:4Fe-4S dicluster domain-containing protein [Candidatus Omnitrophota bacterium]